MASRKTLRFLALGIIAGVLAATRIAPAAAEERTFTLNIERNAVAPELRTLRVRKDDVVNLEVKADRALLLHVHGLKLELTVSSGSPARASFTANATGRFPIEVHAAGAHQHARHHGPPLSFLEVMPK